MCCCTVCLLHKPRMRSMRLKPLLQIGVDDEISWPSDQHAKVKPTACTRRTVAVQEMHCSLADLLKRCRAHAKKPNQAFHLGLGSLVSLWAPGHLC